MKKRDNQSARSDANPELRKAGETCLMKAAFWGNVEVVELLLTSGADANATDNEGRAAAVIADEIGQVRIVEMLSEASALGR